MSREVCLRIAGVSSVNPLHRAVGPCVSTYHSSPHSCSLKSFTCNSPRVLRCWNALHTILQSAPHTPSAPSGRLATVLVGVLFLSAGTVVCGPHGNR